MQLKTYLIYCLILYLVLVIRTLLYIEKEKTRRAEKRDGRNRKRENQGEGCRRPLARSSHLLLLRLMSSPSTPSTAAHTSPRRTITEGTGGHLVHFWAMLSPPHRNTSPPTSRPFLASLLLRLISSPSTPSTATHTSPRRTITEGTGGHLVRFWAMLSPPPRHRSNRSKRPQGIASG